jgi:hypothetical protein
MVKGRREEGGGRTGRVKDIEIGRGKRKARDDGNRQVGKRRLVEEKMGEEIRKGLRKLIGEKAEWKTKEQGEGCDAEDDEDERAGEVDCGVANRGREECVVYVARVDQVERDEDRGGTVCGIDGAIWLIEHGRVGLIVSDGSRR